MSPYLFVLCMERLGHLIQDKLQNKSWHPILLSKKGPPLSHLFFADDLFHFAEASMEQAHLIQDVLQDFCTSSGQRVNKEKTRIFFSKNASPSIISDIGSSLGFKVTKNLGRYLGTPLIHGRKSRSLYADLVSSVRGKLATWKARTLSFAGRITLVRSILQSVPLHIMQTSLLPNKALQELDKISRDFLWNSSEEKRRLHLISWDALCSLKDKGGLGIHLASDLNKVSLMNLVWRLRTKSDSLWARVLLHKYSWTDAASMEPQAKAYNSNTWKAICSHWAAVSSHTI